MEENMSSTILYLVILAAGASCLSLFDNSIYEVIACIVTIYASYNLGKLERARW
tara:strand:+ start:319 stop:480 length:162 start_codon:yes stop_codon:yes gene_type:complete